MPFPLEFQGQCEVERIVQCAIRPVSQGVGLAFYLAAPVVSESIADCPVPALPMVAKTEVAQVQVGIWNDRIEVLIGAGIFAVNVPDRSEVPLPKLIGDTELIHETGGVIPHKNRIAKGGVMKRSAAENSFIQMIPIGPIQVELEIPIFRRPEGSAAIFSY